MHCWTYAVTWPEKDKDPEIKILYSGTDKAASANIAKQRQHEFNKVVADCSDGSCLYHWINPFHK